MFDYIKKLFNRDKESHSDPIVTYEHEDHKRDFQQEIQDLLEEAKVHDPLDSYIKKQMVLKFYYLFNKAHGIHINVDNMDDMYEQAKYIIRVTQIYANSLPDK